MRLHFQKSVNNDYESKILPNFDNRPVNFFVIQYDEIRYAEHHFTDLAGLNSYLTTTSYSSEEFCTWINVEGIHRTDILDELSIRFNIHSLIKEDISTINERMKLDVLENGSCIYLLLQLIYMYRDVSTELDHVQQEQISILLNENNFLLTFQEAKSDTNAIDVFQGVKHRLRNNRGRIRSLKIDYLFHCLFDVIIEHYMSVLDHISVKIDMHEKLLMKKLKQNTKIHNSFQAMNFEQLKSMFDLKHDMLRLRIVCKPLRDIIIKLQKAHDRVPIANQTVHSRRQYRRKKRPKHIALSGNYFANPNSDSLTRRWSLGSIQGKAPLFNEYIFMYFKDLNDHILQLHDRIDTYCDLISSSMTFYMILNDAEMNKIMRFFTFMSSIFIPMMFIVGLFSMNYQNSPPLTWHFGYFVTLIALGTCATVLLSVFKWNRWI
ncbi:unnamed protein product [Adineta ricciae]|uniref:Uncharacterized protein n=1 Tax=Adineta ricciae TaxID=249248 RepID=A0A816G0A5_ADIRI|nr:unnamed protein product [Adineta ricciae]